MLSKRNQNRNVWWKELKVVTDKYEKSENVQKSVESIS